MSVKHHFLLTYTPRGAYVNKYKIRKREIIMKNTTLESNQHRECKHCEDINDVGNTIKNHPDHTSFLSRLNKVKGQLSGIEKMILERRYCVDILTQFKAVAAGLKFIELSILKQHIQSCVRGTMEANNRSKIEEKIAELIKVVSDRIE